MFTIDTLLYRYLLFQTYSNITSVFRTLPNIYEYNTHFFENSWRHFYFYTPWKLLYSPGFLMFSGLTEMEKPLTILAKKLHHRCLTESWIYLWTFYRLSINPLSANPTKWSNTLKQFVGNLPTNCLSVFDHFVKLALKG